MELIIGATILLVGIAIGVAGCFFMLKYIDKKPVEKQNDVSNVFRNKKGLLSYKKYVSDK